MLAVARGTAAASLGAQKYALLIAAGLDPGWESRRYKSSGSSKASTSKVSAPKASVPSSSSSSSRKKKGTTKNRTQLDWVKDIVDGRRMGVDERDYLLSSTLHKGDVPSPSLIQSLFPKAVESSPVKKVKKPEKLKQRPSPVGIVETKASPEDEVEGRGRRNSINVPKIDTQKGNELNADIVDKIVKLLNETTDKVVKQIEETNKLLKQLNDRLGQMVMTASLAKETNASVKNQDQIKEKEEEKDFEKIWFEMLEKMGLLKKVSDTQTKFERMEFSARAAAPIAQVSSAMDNLKEESLGAQNEIVSGGKAERKGSKKTKHKRKEKCKAEEASKEKSQVSSKDETATIITSKVEDTPVNEVLADTDKSSVKTAVVHEENPVQMATSAMTKSNKIPSLHVLQTEVNDLFSSAGNNPLWKGDFSHLRAEIEKAKDAKSEQRLGILGADNLEDEILPDNEDQSQEDEYIAMNAAAKPIYREEFTASSLEGDDYVAVIVDADQLFFLPSLLRKAEEGAERAVGLVQDSIKTDLGLEKPLPLEHLRLKCFCNFSGLVAILTRISDICIADELRRFRRRLNTISSYTYLSDAGAEKDAADHKVLASLMHHIENPRCKMIYIGGLGDSIYRIFMIQLHQDDKLAKVRIICSPIPPKRKSFTHEVDLRPLNVTWGEKIFTSRNRMFHLGKLHLMDAELWANYRGPHKPSLYMYDEDRVTRPSVEDYIIERKCRRMSKEQLLQRFEP